MLCIWTICSHILLVFYISDSVGNLILPYSSELMINSDHLINETVSTKETNPSKPSVWTLFQEWIVYKYKYFAIAGAIFFAGGCLFLGLLDNKPPPSQSSYDLFAQEVEKEFSVHSFDGENENHLDLSSGSLWTFRSNSVRRFPNSLTFADHSSSYEIDSPGVFELPNSESPLPRTFEKNFFSKDAL